MKYSISAAARMAFTVLGAVLLLTGCKSTPNIDPHANDPAEQPQVERRLQEILDAAEQKDVERLDSYHLYGPKFTKFSAALPSRQDAATARQGEHQGLATLQGLKMRPIDLKIDVFGNVAIATFVLDVTFKTSSGTTENKELSTLVFVKDRGSWKLTHEHFTPVKSAP